jgi:hypothetical protein
MFHDRLHDEHRERDQHDEPDEFGPGGEEGDPGTGALPDAIEHRPRQPQSRSRNQARSNRLARQDSHRDRILSGGSRRIMGGNAVRFLQGNLPQH